MSTPVADEPSLVPEELVLGPRPSRSRPRWVIPMAVALGVLLVLVAAAAWRFWPRPVEPLSLADLQDVYAGMVRADGTNDASVLTRQTVAETPMTVNPPDCAALVQATVANRFPDAAIDGVGTYWLGEGPTISLFTLRFGDTAQAEAERSRVASALDACADRSIDVRRTQEIRVRAWRATVGRTAVGSGDDDQIGWTLSGSEEVMAIQLMPYLNTLTWQYRYEPGAQSYSPLAADRLMQSLVSQLDAVAAARPT
jgi:hypothetical protein